MMYDDRLIIKQHFVKDDKDRVNGLKLIEQYDFVQVYVDSGQAYAQISLDRSAIEKVIKYLQNSLDSLK